MKQIITLLIWLLSMHTVFSQAPTNAQLAYYQFDNGSSNNSINSLYNGTAVGASATNDRNGNSNSALLFTGNTFVDFNYNSNLHPNHNQKTYMFWMKFNNSNPNNTLIYQNGNADLSAGQFRIEINSHGRFLALFHSYWGYGGGSIANDVMEITAPNFDWTVYHHVAFSITDNIVKYYLDGNLVGTKTWTLPYLSYNSNFNFRLGGLYNNPNNNNPVSWQFYPTFNGVIDDFRIYDRSLTDNEILLTYNYENNTNIPTNGLVAYFPFNGSTNDESGYANHGVDNGGGTYTLDAFGNCNSAYAFDGVDDYLNIPNSPSLQSPTQAITIATWIKVNDIGTNGAYFLCKNSLGNLDPFQYRMGIGNDSSLYFGFKNSPTSSVDFSQSISITNNEWKFIAVTYNGETIAFYADGELIGTQNYTGQLFPDDKSLDIGRDAHGPIEMFNGALDNLRLYNTTLTQQQIADLYEAEKPDPLITNPQGVTVICHGFSPSFSEDWSKFANAIRVRNGGGAIYKNNPNTGQWELINDTLGIGNYTPDYNKELILIYDWASLSNNISDGYLEASANNLFALLNNPPAGYSDLLTKPKHFIGHSRGGVLTLQLCYLIKKYLPNVVIEHVTTLDPHPASPMGDVSQSNENFSLPGVYGTPTDCSSITGCENGDNVYLKFPNNVSKLDNYYQKDGFWEGIQSAGDFDGVEVRSASGYSANSTDPNNFNRQLKTDGGLGNPIGCPYHTMVHDWYLATILPLENNISSYASSVPLINTSCTSIVPNEWFGVTSAGNTISAHSSMWGTREQIGYRQSRLGSISNCILNIPLTNAQNLVDIDQLDLRVFNRTGNQHQPVFNGSFQYGTAGWEKNNMSQNVIPINFENGYAELNNFSNSIIHSFLYFGKRSEQNLSENYTTLKFDFAPYDIVENTAIKISFFDGNSNLIQSYSFNLPVSIQTDNFKTLFCPIPETLNNKTGTFKIELTNFVSKIKIDNVTFTTCYPLATDLYLTMPDPSTLNFSDIEEDHWAKEGIYKSRNYGLFRGTSSTTFTPDTQLSKAEAITVLVRAGIQLGLIAAYNTTGQSYNDVTACNQYFPYIQTAKNLGYLENTNDFNLSIPITVAQLCVYMDKLLKINLHDWNASTPYLPWVLAPTSLYIQSQLSQIAINQPQPEQNEAMRRILHCIDVVKNNSTIDSYRTQNVWTLKDIENTTISDGQPIEVDGSANVTRARMAVASANLFRFVYKKLNNGNVPDGRISPTTTTNIDPTIDDFIGIGTIFDNKDLPTTDTPEAPTQITYTIDSGATLALQYQSDSDVNGNPQFFYWSMNKNVDGNNAQLASVPINGIQNHRKINFIAPVVTETKTWYLYSYLANNKGKIKETVLTINVAPSLATNDVHALVDTFRIYPNPTNSILNIDSMDTTLQRIEIYDLEGKLVQTISKNQNQSQIDMTHYSAGTYLIKLTSKNSVQTVKVIKQ